MSWIKCSESLPDEGVPVLVWSAVGYWPESGVIRAWREYTWDRSEWKWETGTEWDQVHVATHWQPLPEPPNE